MLSGSVECIENVHCDNNNELKLFTKGKTYGVHSGYRAEMSVYELMTCDDENNTHIISDSQNNDYSDFENDEWFKKHFIFVIKN